MSALVGIERDGYVVTVTLNRPDAMNALSIELRKQLTEGFRALQADDDVRVVVLTGAGRAFCAGFDLKEMASGAADTSAEEIGNEMQDVIHAFDRPIIGAINGHAITGGFELALACDVLIASENAKFADTHIRVGMLPGWGLSQKLPRLIGISRAKEISLSSNFVLAAQALEWGLVNRVVLADELLPAAQALASDIATNDTASLRAYKRLIDEGFGMSFSEALTHENTIAIAAAREMTAAHMAERRTSVQERGREQDD